MRDTGIVSARQTGQWSASDVKTFVAPGCSDMSSVALVLVGMCLGQTHSGIDSRSIRRMPGSLQPEREQFMACAGGL